MKLRNIKELNKIIDNAYFKIMLPRCMGNTFYSIDLCKRFGLALIVPTGIEARTIIGASYYKNVFSMQDLDKLKGTGFDLFIDGIDRLEIEDIFKLTKYGTIIGYSETTYNEPFYPGSLDNHILNKYYGEL